MPALVLRAPLSGSLCPFLFGNAFRPVLRREKPGGIFADNLLLGIAEYVLRSVVPVGHDAVRIHEENCIVTDVFDCFAIYIFSSAIYRATLSAHVQSSLEWCNCTH